MQNMTGDVFFDVTKPQYFIKLMTVLSISIHAFGRPFCFILSPSYVSRCLSYISHIIYQTSVCFHF